MPDDRDAWGVREQLRYLIEKVDRLAAGVVMRDDLADLERRHAAELSRLATTHKTDTEALHARINGIRTDLDAQRAKAVEADAEKRKMRSQQFFTILMSFIGPAAAIIVGLILGGK